jgi:transposase
VLCVDEKSGIQALDRSQPVLPMMPGMPERRTHDYARNGVTSLFAAFNIADGTVISELHRRHRAVEFLRFLKKIDKAVPAGLDVHLVCDNLATHKTPEVQLWLARRPRFHVHFTPTGSSWINQVERWFGYLTEKKADIRAWIETWDENPRPFACPAWRHVVSGRNQSLDAASFSSRRIVGKSTAVGAVSWQPGKRTATPGSFKIKILIIPNGPGVAVRGSRSTRGRGRRSRDGP